MSRNPRMFARTIDRLMAPMTIGTTAMLAMVSTVRLMEGRSVGAIISSMINGVDVSVAEKLSLNFLRSNFDSVVLIDVGVAATLSMLLLLAWWVSKRWQPMALMSSAVVFAICCIELITGSALTTISRATVGLFMPHSFYDLPSGLVLSDRGGFELLETFKFNFMMSTSALLALLPVFIALHFHRAKRAAVVHVSQPA